MEEFVRKVCMCGDSGVGKTSLIRRFVTGFFDEKYISTLGTLVLKKSVYCASNDSEMKLLIWDISGQSEFKRIHASAFKNATGALAVCDVTRPETARHFQDWISNLLEFAERDVPVVCLINKFDLAEANPNAVASVKRTLESYRYPIYTTSAKTGYNVEDAFKTLAEAITTDKPKITETGVNPVEIPEAFENPSEFLDYITIRFCTALDDQEMGMHIVRKQVADESIDFQSLTEDGAKRLTERLVSIVIGFKGDEAAQMLRMDLNKAYWRFVGNS